MCFCLCDAGTPQPLRDRRTSSKRDDEHTLAGNGGFQQSMSPHALGRGRLRMGDCFRRCPASAQQKHMRPISLWPKRKNEAALLSCCGRSYADSKALLFPINSPYAIKRRANEELWTTQEGHAIQQVPALSNLRRAAHDGAKRRDINADSA